MTLLVDTSVVLTWWHAEDEVDPARQLLDNHRSGNEHLLLLDLLEYELGNVLPRPLGRCATAVSQQLDLVGRLCGHSAPRSANGTA